MTQSARDSLLREFVDQYYGLIYRYAYRLTGDEASALDLTQTCFLQAHAHFDQLRDSARGKVWLLTIVRNAFRRECRSKSVRKEQAWETLEFPAAAMPVDPEFDAEQLQRALDSLAEEYRTPLILYYFQELSYQEIADVMEIRLGTVMSRLSRAKQQLRNILVGSRPPEVLSTK